MADLMHKPSRSCKCRICLGESREAGNSRVRGAGGRPDGETGLCPGYKQPGGPGALAVWKWWCAGEQVYGYVEAGWEGRWKRSEK